MPEETLWTWDDRSRRYRDTKTGRYIGTEKMNELRSEYQTVQKSRMAGIAEGYRKGSLSFPEFQNSAKRILKETYVDLYVMGSGGRNNLTSKDWGAIGSLLRTQYGRGSYMEGLMREIYDGKLSEAQIANRLNMYVNSATHAFWRANTSNIPLVLPAYPGDGSTVCLTNCQCVWDIVQVERGYDCYWLLGVAEHCPDCMARAQAWNPYEVRV